MYPIRIPLMNVANDMRNEANFWPMASYTS